MLFFLSAKGLPVAVKARLSGRSRSSFYYQRIQPKKDESFWENEVRPLHEARPFYGYKRIAKQLGVSHKRVYRCMRLHGIRAKTTRRRRGKNQYSKGKPSLPNLMKDMSIDHPNQVWAGDFTHFVWKRRIYYLATVMDIFTRQIVGWHVSSCHNVELVMEALRMALGKRSKAPRIFHSDHGSEYISEEYLSQLKAHGISPSNAGKGKPWQNGFVESWNYRFKEEFGDPNRFHRFDQLFQEMCSKVKEYNSDRIHSALKMSPDAFHMKKTLEPEAMPAAQEAA